MTDIMASDEIRKMKRDDLTAMAEEIGLDLAKVANTLGYDNPSKLNNDAIATAIIDHQDDGGKEYAADIEAASAHLRHLSHQDVRSKVIRGRGLEAIYAAYCAPKDAPYRWQASSNDDRPVVFESTDLGRTLSRKTADNYRDLYHALARHNIASVTLQVDEDGNRIADCHIDDEWADLLTESRLGQGKAVKLLNGTRKMGLKPQTVKAMARRAESSRYGPTEIGLALTEISVPTEIKVTVDGNQRSKQVREIVNGHRQEILDELSKSNNRHQLDEAMSLDEPIVPFNEDNMTADRYAERLEWAYTVNVVLRAIKATAKAAIERESDANSKALADMVAASDEVTQNKLAELLNDGDFTALDVQAVLNGEDEVETG